MESNMQHKKKMISPSATLVRRPSRHAQRGASLLEAIAYLGIAAIVVIGAVALLNGAFSSAGTNELAEQVNSIQAGVKKLYMGQTNGYTDVSNSVLASAGVFPNTIPVTNGTATNTWGGNVTVTGTGTGTFQIDYSNIPTPVCINAVTSGGSWTSITVNGTAVTTLPLTPTQAQADCSAGNANDVIWTSS
jgi:outer membrane murein-binding lipoprotein Lpp